MSGPATAAPRAMPRKARTPERYSGVRAFAQRRLVGDDVARALVGLAAIAIIAITVMIVVELWTNSELARHKFGWGFIMGKVWDPNADTFGVLPYAYGTIVTSVLALLIAVPIGVGAAIFLSELAPPRVSDALTFAIELLAAVPSVIYGFIGIFVLLPFLKAYIVPPLRAALGWTPLFTGPYYGPSMFSAAVVLAIMTLPFIVSVSRQVLLAVPHEQREGALALGATRWETTWKVVVPFARRGIIGSVFLALARALGETMAVTMVIGNSPQIKASLLAPGYSIAAVIANEFSEATTDLYKHALIESALVLFAVTIIFNGLARLLVAGGSRQAPAQ